MNTRRSFLRDAGALTLGGLVLPQLVQADSLFPALAPRPIGLQLFTLFRPMSDDPKGTLEKVAAVGYKEVESAFSLRGGYYGYTAKEFKKVVEDLGMTWRAHHAMGPHFGHDQHHQPAQLEPPVVARHRAGLVNVQLWIFPRCRPCLAFAIITSNLLMKRVKVD
ncbi:twin-arginine translocation signal domain-containing protein [Spirosoma telluris]|uniref:twin-arginine translocation signal domain-containing protein n=1 Tax=Spirosoma telluris TaxID=2183553 RepID=UPI002FC361CD